MKFVSTGAFAALMLATASHAAPSAPTYRLSATVPLGAPDRWDYVVVDGPSHRVYVAHGDRVTVVDGREPHVVGEVAGIAGGTHGVAISHADGRGYTDDGEGGKAVAFDLATLKITKLLPAAQDADAIARDPKTGHIFTVNGDSGSLTVIDPARNAVIATINAGGKLEYAVADGAGKLYVNGAGDKTLLRIDTATNVVDARWPIPDCTSPHGMAMDVEHRRVFVSCVNSRLVVVDADSGREVAGLPIGAGTDAAAFDPVRRRVFSSNGRDGTLSVIQEMGPDSYKVIDTVTTQVSGRTMAVDPATGRVFIAAADLDTAAPPGPGGRPRFKPGSLKLLVLDPAH